MKILFMGTPTFGATILKALATAPHEIVGVVTQPDRPAGRKNTLTPPPVKLAAQELGLPLMQVEKLRDPAIQAHLGEFSKGADVFVVASFGMILPVAVLSMPPLGCINVHASLLPAYRGASPVAQAILDGLSETGVTIMLMEKGLDTGAMLRKIVTPISPDDTQETLLEKLAADGAKVLIETLEPYAEGKIQPIPQDHSQATHTGIIKKEDGLVNWDEPAVKIERKTRAYDPWPGVFTTWEGQTLKIGRSDLVSFEENPAEPNLANGITALGKINGKERLLIKTGSGWLAPRELQLPGKKMLAINDFLRGQGTIVGAKLG
jgi:methionyl-tRNA formyltransferase